MRQPFVVKVIRNFLLCQAFELGLVGADRFARLNAKESEIVRVKQLLESHRVEGVTLEKLLKRTETQWSELENHLPS